MYSYHILNCLSEKVHAIDYYSDNEDIKYEISTFFMKLMKRKRSDKEDEGLQAGGVIYPDKAGFKVCERDGKASHAQAQENVSQYLNGETEYSSEEYVGMVTTRKNDPNSWANITKKGFSVRIVANEDEIQCKFLTESQQITPFQLRIIYRLFSSMKQVYDVGLIDNIHISYVTPKEKIIFRDGLDTKEQIDQFDEFLNTKINPNTKKTRAF